MQTDKKQSHQSTKDGENFKRNYEQELSLQLLDRNQEENDSGRNDWLNEELNRFPYQLYKYWLFLDLAIVVAIECFVFKDFWTINKELKYLELEEIYLEFSMWTISHIFLLYGCCQMLFGMTQKKAGFAQKSLTKFQMSMIGWIIGSLSRRSNQNSVLSSPSLVDPILTFGLPSIILMNLIGGFAVIKAFKRNHPLARKDGSETLDALSTDLLQQNEAIASELLKYDQQLDRWPYLIYKFWLWLSFVLAIFSFSVSILFAFQYWKTDEVNRVTLVFFSVSFLLNGFWNYEMIITLRRKILAKSKRTVFSLKIYIYITVIIFGIFGTGEDFLEDLIALVIMTCIPLINLIGALNVTRVLLQREQFVSVSSFNDDESYL